jgi:hypothetical protein
LTGPAATERQHWVPFSGTSEGSAMNGRTLASGGRSPSRFTTLLGMAIEPYWSIVYGVHVADRDAPGCSAGGLGGHLRAEPAT